MGRMMSWDDLRYFLAVAETGSTLAAGRALRVSQTTAARRVAALEEALGLKLFEKRQAGYALTAAGEALVDDARQVEEAAGRFLDAAASQSRELAGTVRLTTEEVFAITVLAPILRDFQQLHPGIMIELDTSEKVRDLAAGTADVALRSTEQPQGAGLVGRRIAYDNWTVYCSKDYAEAHGQPQSLEDLKRHPLIGGGSDGMWRIYRQWMERHGLEKAVVMHHGTPSGLLSAVRAGSGVAALPCFVADQDPELLRCLPPGRNNPRGLWLLTHERVRNTPRVRAVLDFLAERLSALA